MFRPTDFAPQRSGAPLSADPPTREEMHARMQELLRAIRASLGATPPADGPTREPDGSSGAGACERLASGGHTAALP